MPPVPPATRPLATAASACSALLPPASCRRSARLLAAALLMSVWPCRPLLLQQVCQRHVADCLHARPAQRVS